MLILICILGLVLIPSAGFQTASANGGAAQSQQVFPVLVRRVTFAGSTTLPQAEQRTLARELEGKTYPSDTEVARKVENFWGEFGFMRARAKIESEVYIVEKQRMADLIIKIDEGNQYRLEELRSTTALFTPAQVETMFSMKPGDLVDLTKLRRGTEKLKTAYIDRGYSQVTILGQTRLNEADRTLVFYVDVVPGAKDSIDVATALCKSVLRDVPKGSLATSFSPVLAYDPRRNALQDVENAILEASKTKKNVLLDVGGDWCAWCHILNRTFQENASLSQLRDANFVTVFVNESEENRNDSLLSRMPRISGAPHLFVLDQSGNLLVSEDPVELEEGRSYSAKRIEDFLRRWSPPDSGSKCPQQSSGEGR